MAYPVQTKRVEFFIDDDGVVTHELQVDLTENLIAPLDLKAFYKDMAEMLQFNDEVRFLDVLGGRSKVRVGDYLDYQAPTSFYATATSYIPARMGDMFENHFTWTTYKNGTMEMETLWDFRAPTKFTKQGWFEFHMNLVARVITEKTYIMPNGEKKKYLHAMWEFRNKLRYKNFIILKSLNKMPIVKNSPFLRRLYVDHIAVTRMLKDIDYCYDKLKPLVYAVINKHFKPVEEPGQPVPE